MAHSKFFHYFPIPSYLRMQSTGFSMEDGCARFIEIIKADGEFTVTKHGLVEFPPQAIVEGEIVKAEEVAAALSKAQSEHHVRFAQVALPDDKVYIFKQRLPAISEKEVRSALEFKIDENIPISSAEAIFDYEILDGALSDSVDVVVGAVAVATSEAYSSAFNAAGIQPLRFGLESQAVANAVVPEDDKGTILLLNFSSQKTGISIVENNVVQFSLTLRNDDAPAQAAALEDGAVAPVVIKPQAAAWDLEALKREVDKVLNYWRDKEGIAEARSVTRVIAAGAEAANAEFVGGLSKVLGMPVLAANPWCNVIKDGTRTPPLSPEESLRYAAAIGSAIAYTHIHNRNV